MRTTTLLSTAAAVLLLGAGTVAAQSSKDQPRPERAPAAQQNAPAEKMAPSMHSGKSSETTGQGTRSPDASEAPKGAENSHSSDTQSGMHKNGTTGAAPKSEMNKSETTDTNKMNKSDQNKSEMKKGGAETKGQAGMQKNEQSGNKNNNANVQEKNSQNATGKNGTTGQGAAGSSTKLTTQQRTKITSIIREKKVQPTQLNISVHVGARVPTSVHFYPLPTQVIEVYPQWRGYDYILVGEEILIIDPGSHEIVAVLTA